MKILWNPIIDNLGLEPGQAGTKGIQHEKINSSEELFSNTLFTDELQ